MKHVAPVRREMGMATIFNLIGPLTNPAGARHQLIGVADARYVERIAQAVRLMGSERNLIVHSDDGLDEISTTCPTAVVEVFAGQGFDVRYEVAPQQFGLRRARLEELRGGDSAENADHIREVLDDVEGPRLDIVLLNAGAALYIAEAAASIAEGVDKARAAVASGAARAKLDALVEHDQPALNEEASRERLPDGDDHERGHAHGCRAARAGRGAAGEPRAARPPARGAGRAGRPRARWGPTPLAVIAEIKRRSPSKGEIAPDLDAAEQARAYEAAGADAISVLTEPDRFGGSLDDLLAVTAAVDIPVLRKDFIIDPYQIWEAADAGAAAVLLIVAALPSRARGRAPDECHGLRPRRPRRGARRRRPGARHAVGAPMMGVNNRDLHTLEVDLAVSEYLGALIGACVLFVSESGIGSPSDARRVRAAGAQAILVGEALVGTPHGHLAAAIAALRDGRPTSEGGR